MDIAVTFITAFVIQLGSHYFPWAQVAGKRKLPRVAAYIIGTATNCIILSAWLYFRADWLMIGMLWGVMAAGGLGVIAGYALDAYIRARAAQRENRETVDLLMEQRDER